MADYDAGTARAHIKVDGDSTGADKATRSVEGFQRALEFIAGHLGSFVAAMDKIDSELKNTEGDFKDAADAADKYNKSLHDVDIGTQKSSKSTKEFARNIDDLHSKLKFAHDAMADFGLPTLQAARAMSEFNKQGGGIRGVIAGFSRAGIAGTLMATLKSHVIGMGAALRQAPVWQQSLARLAQNIGLVTLAGSKLGGVVPILERGFSRIVAGAEGADFALAGFSRSISGLDKVLGGAGNFFNTLDRVPTGLFKMAGGLAVAQSGLRGLQTRFALLNTVIGQGGGRIGQALRFVLLPGVLLSSAATQGLDVALRGLSNTFAGLWSGIKQLSGGFLALPGLIATVGAAALPIIGIAKTLSSNFKDLISAVNANDTEKFAQAMQKIPPYLRPLAQAVANAIGPLKSLGDVLTATFVSSGLDQQFTQLVNTWLPAVSTGADQVANSWKILTNSVASFLGEAQTVSTVNGIFMHTSQIMNTVSTSIGPVLDGLRGITAVGSTFIRDLAQTYLPQIANKFGNWANNAVATGQAMAWMQGSVHAAKELYIGLDQLVRATWSLLTLFQTKSGDTFLDRFAASMTKFNNAVTNSAANGELRKIADSVKNIGTDKLHELWQIFKDALPSIHSVVSALSDMSAAFSRIMLPTIEAVISTIGALAQGFDALGGGAILGTIFGITKAFGILRVGIGTALDAFKVFLGLSFFKSGAEAVVIGLAGSLEKFGPIGQKASGALLNIGDSMAGMVQKAAIGATAIFAYWQALEDGANEIKASSQAIDDASKHTTSSLENLTKAFYEDKGTTGRNVIAQLASNTKQSLDDLQNVSDKAPGITAHLKDSWDHMFDWSQGIGPHFGGSDQLQQLSNAAKDAGDVLNATNTALTTLGVSSQDLSKYVYGSNDAFSKFVGTLSAAGQTGAITYWSKLRDQFTALQNDMERAGPGAIILADGISKIGSAGSDSAAKLSGLKLALEGLGLLKQDQYEAALNLAKAITGLGDAAANAADKSQPLDNLLDPNTGILNTRAGVNANNLYNAVQPLAAAFQTAAANGEDLNDFWQRSLPNLDKLADSFHVTHDQIIKFAQGLGIDPPIVQLLVQAKDDKVEQGIIAIAAKAQASLNNQAPIELNMGVNAGQIQKDLNTLFNDPNAVGLSGGNIVLKPGIDQAAINKIQDYLHTKYGIQLGPNQPPVDPNVAATVPVTPTGPAGAPLVPAPGTPPPDKNAPGAAATPPAPKPVKQPPLPPGLPGSQEFPAPVDVPSTPAAGKPTTPLPPGTYFPPSMAPAGPGTPGLLPGQVPVPPPSAPVNAPLPPVPPVPPPSANVPQANLAQFDDVQGRLKALADALAKNIAEWAAWNAGIDGVLSQVLQALDGFIQGATQKLSDAANQSLDAGKKFSQDFAAGITDPASLQKISDAAITAMQTAAAKLPAHSPAKEGPLSGEGWSGAAGGKYSSDFAQGILGGQQLVGDAASKIMGKAAGALKPKTPYGSFGFTEKGEPFKQLKDILKFASDGLNAFKSVSDNVFKLIDFIQDPTGQKAKQQQANVSNKTGGAIGGILNQGVSALAGITNPNKEDIASAIAGEAQKRGYDRNAAIAAISAVMHEDPSFNPNQQELGGSDHWGLFQQQGNYPGAHGGAAGQIGWFFDQLDALGGPGAPGLKSDPLDVVASQIEKGGYGGPALQQHAVAAANLYDSVLQKGALSGVGADALPGIGALTSNPASAASRVSIAPTVEAGVQSAHIAPLYQPGSTNLPPWMQQLAQSFGLTASTYPSGGSLHQMGFAADFNGPEAGRQQLAQYIASNLKGQTLQLIYQDPNSGQKYGVAGGQQVGPGTSQPGYYASDFGEHTDHVHWATDVAPILAAQNANAMPWAAGNMPNQQAAYGSQNPILPPGGAAGQPSQQPVSTGTVDPTLSAGLGQTPGSQTNQPTAQTAQLFGSQTELGGQTQDIQNTAQQVAGGISSASNIASSVMQTLQAGLDAWGATKYIADQAVRGISDTEDIYNLVDQFQKYITFAADVANTAGQITSMAGSFTGGSDFGGTAAAGQALQLVSALLTTVNNVIDLGQEAYRIFGSYFGQFLGFLTGGAAGMMGDVHFLLDQNTGQLLNYSGDNPLNKVAHNIPGATVNPNANNQAIGQLNYYAGPGQDPRDSTRQMMYTVRATQMSTVTAQ